MTRSFDSSERIAFVVAGVVVVSTLSMAVRAARKHGRVPTGRELAVPHMSDALKLDGELDEASWRDAARSGAFVTTDGTDATPYSDARFAWSDDALRIGLYAADEDIVTAHVGPDGPVWKGDAFHVVLTVDGVDHELDVDPKCTLTDGRRAREGAVDYAWQSGARLACDADGTIDVAGDRDEEWVVEMEVPLAKLGVRGAGDRIGVRVRRCDVGANGRSANACGEAKRTLVLAR